VSSPDRPTLPRGTRLLGLLAVVALLLPVLAAAGPRHEECTSAYTNGAYAEAAACFEDLEDDGHLTGDLLYDQGNAWYRAGENAKAIVAWRRAELLIPRDGDLIANLDAARYRTQDEIPLPRGRGFVVGFLLLPIDSMSGGELLLLGAIGWALLLGGGAVRLRRQYPGASGVLALGGLLVVLGLGGWAFKTWEDATHPVCVVMAEEVTMRSGRDLGSRDLAVLHAGAELSIVERGDEWHQVEINDGPRGWVPAKAITIVELSSRDHGSD